MTADDNIKTITQVYEAFGRGDVAGILDAVTDDVDWAAEADSTAAPWYGVRHGRDAVAAFFTEFGSTMEVEEFTPVSFAAWEAEVEHSRRIEAAAESLDVTGYQPRWGEDVSLRLVMLHMIHEYARHNGHADFLREGIDGTTGV